MKIYDLDLKNFTANKINWIDMSLSCFYGCLFILTMVLVGLNI